MSGERLCNPSLSGPPLRGRASPCLLRGNALRPSGLPPWPGAIHAWAWPRIYPSRADAVSTADLPSWPRARLASVPGWSRWSCCDCKTPRDDLRGPSPPRDRDWAENTRLGFGKYRGTTIGELARSAKGRAWLFWMVDVVENQDAATAVEAARLVLNEPLNSGPPCPRCRSPPPVRSSSSSGRTTPSCSAMAADGAIDSCRILPGRRRHAGLNSGLPRRTSLEQCVGRSTS